MDSRKTTTAKSYFSWVDGTVESSEAAEESKRLLRCPCDDSDELQANHAVSLKNCPSTRSLSAISASMQMQASSKSDTMLRRGYSIIMSNSSCRNLFRKQATELGNDIKNYGILPNVGIKDEDFKNLGDSSHVQGKVLEHFWRNKNTKKKLEDIERKHNIDTTAPSAQPKSNRSRPRACDGSTPSDIGIDLILKCITDAFKLCSEGNSIYWARHQPDVFWSSPRLTSEAADGKKGHAVNNPRHTKLTWRRTLLSQKRRKVVLKQVNSSLDLNSAKTEQTEVEDSHSSIYQNSEDPSSIRNESLSSKQETMPRYKDSKEYGRSDFNNNGSTTEESFQSQSSETIIGSSLQLDESAASIPTSSLTAMSVSSIVDVYNDSEVHLTERLTKLLNDLKSLWLDVNKMGIVPHINDFDSTNEDQKLRLVNLCSFIVKEMESEWRNFSAIANASDRSSQLTESNRLLREQLECCRADQNCLEANIKIIAKQKINLENELKEVSMQLASLKKQNETRLKKSSSAMSLGFELSPSPSNSTSTEDLQANRAQKREADFDDLIEVMKSSQHNDVNFWNAQLRKNDEDIKALESEISCHKIEKEQIESNYAQLIEELHALQKENCHYESVLKLILQEKQSSGQSLQDLIRVMIDKMNSMESHQSLQDGNNNNSNVSKMVLLEGALQAAQEQNGAYRAEISQLKSKLENSLNNCRLEEDYQKSQRTIQELTRRLNEKGEKELCYEEMQKRKQIQWQDRFVTIACEKEKLENLVEEKDFELRKQRTAIEGFEKRTLRQEKRIQDLHKSNNRLKHEIQDQRRNMEALDNIVQQLRTSLKEQKAQWAHNIKTSSEDAKHVKEHCRWLQTQIEQLNTLLTDAHERIKLHERDKGSLAQQILCSEEERRVVDRKLYELRTTLQGDTVLREALMERNEALQVEISRLRRAKIASLGKTIESWKDDGDFETLTENSVFDVETPLQILHPTDKGVNRKNCYTAVGNNARRPIETSRSIASIPPGFTMGTFGTNTNT